MKPNSKLIFTVSILICTFVVFPSQAIGKIENRKHSNNPGQIAEVSGAVQGSGSPIEASAVTLYAATTTTPKILDQDITDENGFFNLSTAQGQDQVLYIVAKGGIPLASKGNGPNECISLITVLGSQPPKNVVINEMTTIASVWTCCQFLNGDALSGPEPGLSIAAGNVPNFVNLSTGGYGNTIQDPLNSNQTTTMTNFATLSILLAGCVVEAVPDACAKFFDASMTPQGEKADNILTAAEYIAQYPWFNPEAKFDLLDEFYPVPKGKNLRDTPFMPYLNYTPSAWVLALKFGGGGYLAGGKTMIDSEGNAWVGNNFIVGSQGQDYLWQGTLTKFAPNGQPLSPITTGYTGGGLQGPGFGTAIDQNENVWLTTYGSMAVVLFDKNGNPLSPAGGYTFNNQLGQLQGIIATPAGNIWALGIEKNQLIYYPDADPDRGQLFCEGENSDPCRAFAGPFHLAVDQQKRIWVTNSLGDFVTIFQEDDPANIKVVKAGYSGSAVAVDSRGYVWVCNRLGSSDRGKAVLKLMLDTLAHGGDPEKVLTYAMSTQTGGFETGGSMTLYDPDGNQVTGSPFFGGSLPGPWGVAVDGNDNVWVSNFAGASGQIAHLCGTNPEGWPPGMTTGDPISPPLGYVGGGLQMQTDISIDPAGNVWVNNNWQNINSCFDIPPVEALSTQCGGQGITVFYGMAKPVRTPLIGPPRQPE